MLLGFRSDEGTVTAEVMLLLPTLVLGMSACLGVAVWQIERLDLQSTAFLAARQQIVGDPLELPDGISSNFFQDGRYSCVELSKVSLLLLKARSCQFRLGA
jgi:cytochrome oxidase assembly protein ShyY1